MVTKLRLKVPFLLKLMRKSISFTSLVSPPLAARLVNYLWFKTRRFTEPKREKAFLQAAQWKTLELDNNNVQLYIWGEENQPTVLFVHGWNGRAAQLAAFAQGLVEQGYRVIGFDALGHGRSSANKTNLPEISRIIQKIESEYGPLKAGISHSFGGLSLMYAVSTGLEVDKVVCIASASSAKRLVDVFSVTLRVKSKITERHIQLLEKQFGEDMWDRFSMTKMAEKITIPGLIIHDEGDQDVPVSRSLELAQFWKNSELFLTSGLGHRRILRDKQVITKVTNFIVSE